MNSHFSSGRSGNPVSGAGSAGGVVVGKFPAPLWQKAVLFSVAYFLCAEGGCFLSAPKSPFITFWLPAGLYLAVLVLNEPRTWPWLVLAAFPANLAFDLIHAKPLAVALSFYAANMVSAVAGAWLMLRFVRGKPKLSTQKEFFGLVFYSAGFSSLVGATVGAATLVVAGSSQSFGQTWRNWWGGSVAAILVFSPFILVWFSKPDEYDRRFIDQRKKIGEAILLVVVSITFTWYLLVIDKGILSPNKSPVLLPVVWAALRFGLRGATAATVLLALPIAFFTTQYNMGLTPEEVSSGEFVFVMQVALAMTALVGLFPAIVLRERDRKTADLRESEERFQKLTEAAFEGICISENGRILDVNDQLLNMFGYAREEMIGRMILDFVAPESRNQVAEAIDFSKKSIYEHLLLRKDGSSFFAEARSKTMGESNRTLRMTALKDITERKRSEEELEKYRYHLEELVKARTAELQSAREAAESAYKKLRELEKLRDDLVHMVVHDMRSQLMALSMSLECPEEINAPDFQETLHIMREASHSLSTMATSLLDVSRLESGQMPLHCRASDLEQLTNAALKRLSGLSHSCQTTVRASNPPVLAHCDPAVTERIFQNLLDNAFKFTPQNGSILVELVAEEQWALFSISDTGPGIPAEYHAKVFEKFGQVEMRKDRKMPSSGLGLAYCKLAVEAQGGSIRLESEPGHGSTFQMRLPRHVFAGSHGNAP